uniref:Death domain-containing protein n=1 Tax=Globodera pallida TaxID=36090 RepID=A0A183BIB4_GLOPA
MEMADDSSPVPFSASHPQEQQSPELCTNNSTSVSLSVATTTCLTSEGQASQIHSQHAHSSTNSPINLLDEVDANGKLDLSGRQLAALADAGTNQKSGGNGEREHPKIVRLIVSQNSLRSLDCANLPLKHCTEIDASQNELIQMRSLFPLSHNLVQLNLSDNRISSLGSLNSFVCLQTLDLSHNRIEHFPVIDQLSQLCCLNLASNHIKSVPNLSKLTSLVELDLHGNSIRSLDSVRNFLPPCSLRFLDIGGNLVSDLSEFHHLNNCGLFLDSLTVLGNPCTRPNINQRKFSYRPFVYSCILGDLKMLDGCLLSEQEILKGEWLHAQGRSRSFRPGTGAHVQLCAYLKLQCPLVSGEVPLMEDEKLTMVIQKRREYNRSQSSTIITAKLDETALLTDERKADVEAKRKTPERRQKLTNSKTTPVSAGRNQPLKKTTTVTPAREEAEGTKTDNAVEQTPTVTMITAKSVAQLRQALEEEQTPIRERSQSAMDGFETIRTASTLVQPPVSPARTVVLSSSSVGNVLLDFLNNDSNDQQQQSDAAAFPLPPSFVAEFLASSPVSGSSPLSSRIPVNVSLASRTSRHHRKDARNVLQGNAIQQQHSLLPSSSSAYRRQLVSKSEIKARASPARRKNTLERNKESASPSKNSRKMGRFNNLARKLHIRRKSSLGLQQQLAPKGQHSPGTVRFHKLEKSVGDLADQNALLMGINEGHLKCHFQRLESELSVREAEDLKLRSLLVPAPTNLTCKRHEDEEKCNIVEIAWENAIPLMNAVDCKF